MILDCGLKPSRVLLIVNQQSKTSNQTIFAQYWDRVSVVVACALKPCFVSRSTAFAAAVRVRNNPYKAEPDPEREAYTAPARSNAPLMSRSSGYCGKTTLSKSFSIPVRTRSRSRLPARLLPRAGAPVLGETSHADSTRPTSSSLSEPSECVNRVGDVGTGL